MGYTPPQNKEREILSVEDCCQLLGITRRTFSRWKNRRYRPLPTIKVSRKVLVIHSDLLSWLREHREHPVAATPRRLKARQ